MKKFAIISVTMFLALVIVPYVVHAAADDTWSGYKFDYNFVVNGKPVDVVAISISDHVFLSMEDIADIFCVEISFLRPRTLFESHHTVVINGRHFNMQGASVKGYHFVRLIDVADYLKLDILVDDEAKTVYLNPA